MLYRVITVRSAGSGRGYAVDTEDVTADSHEKTDGIHRFYRSNGDTVASFEAAIVKHVMCKPD